jgi:hypothetical protein
LFVRKVAFLKDTKLVIRTRKSKKERQCNGKKKKDRQYNGKKDRQYNGKNKYLLMTKENNLTFVS